MKKICCIGVHGTGKTTLCYEMSYYYKKNGNNVKLVNEVARSCPFGINENFNPYSAMWIVHSHITQELNAIARKGDLIISDRSPIDTIMYAQAMGCLVGHQMKNLFKMAEDWMETYESIYYIRPAGTSAVPDGIRSTDESHRKRVEDCFDDWMERCNMSIQKKFKILTSETIFTKTHCWLEV
jgi:nicotinamide riboside kinase